MSRDLNKGSIPYIIIIITTIIIIIIIIWMDDGILNIPRQWNVKLNTWAKVKKFNREP